MPAGHRRFTNHASALLSFSNNLTAATSDRPFQVYAPHFLHYFFKTFGDNTLPIFHSRARIPVGVRDRDFYTYDCLPRLARSKGAPAGRTPYLQNDPYATLRRYLIVLQRLDHLRPVRLRCSDVPNCQYDAIFGLSGALLGRHGPRAASRGHRIVREHAITRRTPRDIRVDVLIETYAPKKIWVENGVNYQANII